METTYVGDPKYSLNGHSVELVDHAPYTIADEVEQVNIQCGMIILHRLTQYKRENRLLELVNKQDLH